MKRRKARILRQYYDGGNLVALFQLPDGAFRVLSVDLRENRYGVGDFTPDQEEIARECYANNVESVCEQIDAC